MLSESMQKSDPEIVARIVTVFINRSPTDPGYGCKFRWLTDRAWDEVRDDVDCSLSTFRTLALNVRRWLEEIHLLNYSYGGDRVYYLYFRNKQIQRRLQAAEEKDIRRVIQRVLTEHKARGFRYQRNAGRRILSLLDPEWAIKQLCEILDRSELIHYDRDLWEAEGKGDAFFARLLRNYKSGDDFAEVFDKELQEWQKDSKEELAATS